MTSLDQSILRQVQSAVRTDRLLDTAVRLVGTPSPTRSAGAVSDVLASILRDAAFHVERPDAGWPTAPAVACRWDSGKPGRTLQFNGHLDTVHLPFVPPRVENGLLYGSGASDMKGGIAAMVEALLVLRETGLLPGGGILITAHDMHEAPWGDGRQIDRLIDAGYLGDGVLLPEYLADKLPIVGRGLGILEVAITRDGQPVHEVMGGMDKPSVIRAGAELVRRFSGWAESLSQISDPLAGQESCFVGKIASGEIYNQSPTKFELSGTRRWLPGTKSSQAEAEFRAILREVAAASGTHVEGQFHLIRDAFRLDVSDPLVHAFQSAHAAVTGKTLEIGSKPFVDDGNTFCSHGGIPAITHGPNAKGAHTVNEEVPVSELVRVATVYAMTAIAYCGGSHGA